MPVIPCSKCRTALDIDPHWAGQQMQCPACQYVFTVESTKQAPKPKRSRLVTCYCPHCQGKVGVPTNRAGTAITCPTCRGRFKAPLPDAGPTRTEQSPRGLPGDGRAWEQRESFRGDLIVGDAGSEVTRRHRARTGGNPFCATLVGWLLPRSVLPGSLLRFLVADRNRGGCSREENGKSKPSLAKPTDHEDTQVQTNGKLTIFGPEQFWGLGNIKLPGVEDPPKEKGPPEDVTSIRRRNGLTWRYRPPTKQETIEVIGCYLKQPGVATLAVRAVEWFLVCIVGDDPANPDQKHFMVTLRVGHSRKTCLIIWKKNSGYFLFNDDF